MCITIDKIKLIIGLLKKIIEKVPNGCKGTDVDDSAFLKKVLQFDFISILCVLRIIMLRRKILIAQLQVGLNLLVLCYNVCCLIYNLVS